MKNFRFVGYILIRGRSSISKRIYGPYVHHNWIALIYQVIPTYRRRLGKKEDEETSKNAGIVSACLIECRTIIEKGRTVAYI